MARNSQTTQDPSLTTAVIVGSFVSVVPLIAAFLMLHGAAGWPRAA